jgi:prepilin-type processing-associated H-X9-DG protein
VNIADSSTKVLTYEVDERDMNDGQSAIIQSPGTNNSWDNLLSDRHDLVYRQKHEPIPSGSANIIYNSRGSGNAGFCDGHAEYTTRSVVHTLEHAMANAPLDFPTATDPKMQ